MGFLILGLVLFLGVHSLRIISDERRSQWVERLGEKRFKLVYAVLSIAGFVILCVGFAQSKLDPIVIWTPPVWIKHLVSLLVLLACVLVVAAYVPGNHIKARLGHPMYAGVKIWALSHLLANGLLAEIVLFGAFLIWAVLGFRAGRRRDRLSPVPAPEANLRATLLAVALGVAFFAVFAFYLHQQLFGVRPFGA